MDDNFEHTVAGNLTDEGIRQYLIVRFNCVTKINGERIKELEAVFEDEAKALELMKQGFEQALNQEIEDR